MLSCDTDAGYRAARLAARSAATVSARGPPHALRSRASNARVARYRNLRRANGRAARAVGDPPRSEASSARAADPRHESAAPGSERARATGTAHPVATRGGPRPDVRTNVRVFV